MENFSYNHFQKDGEFPIFHGKEEISSFASVLIIDIPFVFLIFWKRQRMILYTLMIPTFLTPALPLYSHSYR